MTADVGEMYEEALAAEAEAGPDDAAESELHQHLTKLALAAWHVLAESVPRLDDEALRSEIAWEVALSLRPDERVVDGVRRWLPASWQERLKRDSSKKLVVNPMNAYVLLRDHPHVRGTIRFNLFTKQVEIRGGPLARRDKDDIDAIVTAAQDWIYALEGVVMNYGDLGRRLVAVALENAFDPIFDYITSLKWDRVPRVMADGGWLAHYAGARSTVPGFVALVGRKFLLGAVARAVDPGAKVDTILLLEGEQGLKKSSLLEALGAEFYADAAIALGDKDSKMLAGSAWILELPDMASFKRSEKNAMKAFFTTRFDKFRAPFGRSIKSYPRRCVFTTTTNDVEVFDDETGNRRYLSVTCYGVNGKIDVAGLLRDRDQLLAEAYHIYSAAAGCPACTQSNETVWAQEPRCDEHSWWPSRTMAATVEEQNAQRDDSDVWTPLVLKWLDNPIKSDEVNIAQTDERCEITTLNCLLYALKVPADRCDQKQKIRIGKILRKAGWIPDKPHRGERVYRRAEEVKPPEPTRPTIKIVKR